MISTESITPNTANPQEAKIPELSEITEYKQKPNYKITQANKDKMLKLRTEQQMTEEQIAKQLDIPRSTIHYHLSRLIDKDALADFQRNETDLISWKKAEIINNLTDDKLKEAKARDLAVAYGIFDDHERLQRGQATNIMGYDPRVVASGIAELRGMITVDNSQSVAAIDCYKTLEHGSNE